MDGSFQIVKERKSKRGETHSSCAIRRPAAFASSICLIERSMSGGGADRDRTGDPLLAKQVLSQLSYSPLLVSQVQNREQIAEPCGHSGQWWVWEDSNFRPHPYQ